jgi:hypothetical protein
LDQRNLYPLRRLAEGVGLCDEGTSGCDAHRHQDKSV